MAHVPLTLAVGDYDHVRGLEVEGVALRVLHLPVEEVFFRFTRFREWEASELSFARYAALRASGDDSLTAIPVFPSRAFRHGALYVREGSALRAPEDLAGRRVGVPEWAQTATVWVRGLLAHRHGVDLRSVRWAQGGVNEPGRREGVPLALPPGIAVEPVADRSLTELLLAGELDAVISARPPVALGAGVVRLLPDHVAHEERYLRDTGIFPIMHVVALRADVHARHPWIARNLMTAFRRARDRSLERLLDVTASHVPLPWAAERARSVLGDDLWPYGVEPNRAALEAFLAYAHEQGVCARRLAPEELFAPQALAEHRV